MTNKITKKRYYCTYDGNPGEWLGIHYDGMSEYHVIMFAKEADKEVAGEILLCYAEEQITWSGDDPADVEGGYQVAAFAGDYDKYRLF